MRSTRPLSQVIPEALAQMMLLLRQERQLVGVEISEKARGAAIGLGLVIAGGILSVPAFFILLLAGVAALEAIGFASYWAALIVAAGVFLVSAVLVVVGLSRLKAKNMLLHATASQIHADADLAKRQFGPDDAFDKRA
ncbi:phage holin family protein [Methyloferula stellata]|uniref:phage holin family protein n=1 Tax=Methyloferula stellata TaxID=876270 RepID=UPI001375D17E|nr:phage holin family protein [Methyloferula stellata]